MSRFGRWLRQEPEPARQPVARGASEVEAAYLAHVQAQAEQSVEDWGGEVEDYLPSGRYSLSKLGEVGAGVLWCVSDDWGYHYVNVLDTGSSAEVFVSKSKDGTELRLRDDVAKAFEGDERLGQLAADTDAELAKWLSPEPVARSYAVLKSEDEQRFTLGVAYPAAEVDSHGDFADEAELELTAWEYLARSRNAGTDHKDGTDGSGVVVESYIYRGPDWTDDDDNVIAKSGDWLLGVVWNEDTWERIKKGELTGYSIQGVALIDDDAEVPDGGDD